MTITAKELERILRTLKKFNVTEYEAEGIKIRVGLPIIDEPISPSKTKPRASRKIEKEAQEIAEKNAIKDQVEEVEEDIENLILSDPAQYERMLAEGDFTDEPERTAEQAV